MHGLPIQSNLVISTNNEKWFFKLVPFGLSAGSLGKSIRDNGNNNVAAAAAASFSQ